MSSAPAQHFLSVLPIQGWRRDHRGSRGEAGAGGLRRDRALRAPPCSVAPLGGRVWRGDPWLGPASVPFFPAILAETKGEEEEEALLGAPPGCVQEGWSRGGGTRRRSAEAWLRGRFCSCCCTVCPSQSPKAGCGCCSKAPGCSPASPVLLPTLLGAAFPSPCWRQRHPEDFGAARFGAPCFEHWVPRGQAGPGGLEESPCEKVPGGTPSLQEGLWGATLARLPGRQGEAWAGRGGCSAGRAERQAFSTAPSLPPSHISASRAGVLPSGNKCYHLYRVWYHNPCHWRLFFFFFNNNNNKKRVRQTSVRSRVA